MIFTSKIMKKRGNDDVKDEACIYDESKVKEIHGIIFSIKIDLDLDIDLERTLGDGNKERGWKERGGAFMNLL